MIFDCFQFFNELELLEIRLHELADVVDYFVLSECTMTHQHEPKPLYFEENKQRFAEFLPKIRHIVVDDAPTMATWDTENYQRNVIVRGLEDATDDDLVVLTDADEIPSARCLREFRPDGKVHFLQMISCYYYVNCLCGGSWEAGKVFPRGLLKEMKATAIRLTPPDPLPLSNGGWHFSYLGGTDRVVKKLKSFAHQECNHEDFTRHERIKDYIDAGLDLFRGLPFTLTELDDTYPRYLLENKEKFRHFIRSEPFVPPSDNCQVWKAPDTETDVSEVTVVRAGRFV